jgi:hypothetical protein
MRLEFQCFSEKGGFATFETSATRRNARPPAPAPVCYLRPHAFQTEVSNPAADLKAGAENPA